MISNGLLTQVAMIALSIGIAITYIMPTFDEIKILQDNIADNQTQILKVVDVNSSLASLVSQMDSVTNQERAKLNKYLPDTVDPVSISRDLLYISSQAGVLYNDSTSGAQAQRRSSASKDDEDDGTNTATAHTFSLSVEGTYKSIKNLFNLLEANDYPLEIRSVNLTRIDGVFLSASLDLATYTYTPEAN